MWGSHEAKVDVAGGALGDPSGPKRSVELFFGVFNRVF